MVRFTEENWNRFRRGKKTTIRTHCLRYGEHNVYGGARYKPKKLGRISVSGAKVKETRDLTEEDAHNDGFACRDDLLLELGRRNPLLDSRDEIVIHQVKVVEDLLTEAA